MEVANTLAYCDMVTITAVIFFIVWSVDVMRFEVLFVIRLSVVWLNVVAPKNDTRMLIFHKFELKLHLH
jgi:hypothetical protein